MVKKILYISNLLLACSHCIASNPSLFEKDDNFVKGFSGNTPVKVGVLGVSYLISPAEDNKTYLQFRNGHLEISKEISLDNLFYFERMDKTPTRFYFKSRSTGKKIKDKTGDKRDKCLIVAHTPNTYEIQFERYKGDSRPFKLQLYPENSQVNLNEKLQAAEGIAWQLHPVYKFQDLTPSQVDSETLLFKISRKEDISNALLSAQQVKSLYTLHRRHQNKMPLTLVHTTDDFLYGSTPELTYLQGIYFLSEDFPLKISNIKAFKAGVAKAALQEARTQASEDKNRNSIVVQRGERLFLMPNYSDTDDSVPAMGDIEITPGEESILPFRSTSYDKVTVTLRSIISEEMTVFSNFAVQRLQGNTFNFINTNKNPLLQPGPAYFMAGHLAKSSIDKLGVVMEQKLSKPLAKSIESLGKSIEVASKNAENALVESSRNLSDGMKISAATLSDTVKFASCSFENAVKTLSFTANGISKDLQKNIPFVLKNLHNTTCLLTSALTEASVNLKEGAQDASQALEYSSRCFERAFDGIGQALRDGTGDITQAIETASQNFVTGMENVKEAAEKLSNVKVKHSIGCSIS